MPVNHHLGLAISLASPASIETQNSYKEKLSFYRGNDYTYIPMPFDDVYFNVSAESLHELEDEQYVHADASIRQTIDHLQNHPFLLIKHRDQLFIDEEGNLASDTWDMPDDWECLGTPEEAIEKEPELREQILNKCTTEPIYHIITLADVNRRVVKETLYSVIAEIEARLSSEIKDGDYSARELYPDLSPETIGRWEKAKQTGIQMHIAEYMKLSEMMKIVGKSENLREAFRYSSRNQFDNDLGGLIDLRNRVMHASRTLVHDREDLEKAIERISRAESAIETHGGNVIRGSYDSPYYSN